MAPPTTRSNKNTVNHTSDEEENLEKFDLDKMTTKDILKEMYKKMENYDKLMKEIKELRETVNQNSVQIENLKKNIIEKDLENGKLKENLIIQEKNLEELKQRSRMINVIINGIHEEKKEDVIKIVTDLGKEIGIDNAEDHIQVAHRLQSKKSPRPIVVRLLNTRTRDLWVRAARETNMKVKKIFVSEHLTVNNYKLLKNVKEWAKQNNHRYVWTQDCRILMRKQDREKVRCIKSMKDLCFNWTDKITSKDGELQNTTEEEFFST